jgi:predicted regulator of Ras-like GTPase activity (Roadblock/LC7/MglB family)
MLVPQLIAKLPEVQGAVVSDRAGGVIDVVRQKDGESVAAVIGFLSSTVSEAGDHLGLGALQMVSFTGPARGGVVAVAGARLVAAFVEPPGSLASVEKLLAAAIERKEA